MALRLPRIRINRTWLMLFIAILMGLVATWLTGQYLKTREQRIASELASRAKGGPTVKVVVPTRDLMRGTTLSTAVLAGRDIATDLVYPETITVDMFDKFDGAKLLHNVERGRPLRTTDVEEKGKDFSDLLDDGTRAITIDVDEINSIAQMVRPGNLVDLYLILPDLSDLSTANNQQIVLFMQRIKVIATGQKAGKGDAAPPPGVPQGVARYSNMTFEVTPEQAARIALAQQLGKIRAVLRKEPDEAIVKLGRINTKNLLKKGFLADEGEETAVEYIIGGRGSSGVGNTITVNVPGLTPPGGVSGPAVPGAAGAPAAAAAGAPATGVPSNIPSMAQPYFPQVPLPPAK